MKRVYFPTSQRNHGFDHLLHDFFNIASSPSACRAEFDNSAFNPNVNIVEKNDSIDLTFELPGLDKSQIKVLVKDNMLTVSGERKFETEEKEHGFIRTEIASGSFSRSFNLPKTVLQDSVNADYKNGLLHISLAKKEESKPKEIEVQIS